MFRLAALNYKYHVWLPNISWWNFDLEINMTEFSELILRPKIFSAVSLERELESVREKMTTAQNDATELKNEVESFTDLMVGKGSCVSYFPRMNYQIQWLWGDHCSLRADFWMVFALVTNECQNRTTRWGNCSKGRENHAICDLEVRKGTSWVWDEIP